MGIKVAAAAAWAMVKRIPWASVAAELAEAWLERRRARATAPPPDDPPPAA